MIDAVLTVEDSKSRAAGWGDIHNYYHQQDAMPGL
jgi:hypothetical protein